LKKIGSGSFGLVFKAKILDDKNDKFVAVKFERLNIKKSVLHLEMAVLSFLQKTEHFARIYYFGKYSRYLCLVMELLGPSIMFITFLEI
jgi:serine/threonine protein kinase